MGQLPQWIIFLAVFVVMAVGFGFLFLVLGGSIYFLNRRKKNLESHFVRLTDSLDGQPQASPLSSLPISRGNFQLRGQYKEMPYTITLSGGGKAQAPSLVLRVAVNPPFKMQLRKENLDTRLSKKIGMASELVIGIDDFDDEYFIQTNQETACRKFLSVPEHREAIRAIDREGFLFRLARREIVLSRIVRGSPYLEECDIIDEPEIERVLEYVYVLSRGLR